MQCVPTLVEEAAGMVILEAMAEGLPLIVTKSGGVVEYIDENVALIIEKDHIVEDLKNAIIYMKEHPEVRRRMIEKAKIYSKRYDEASYYRNFVELINSITKENKYGI